MKNPFRKHCLVVDYPLNYAGAIWYCLEQIGYEMDQANDEYNVGEDSVRVRSIVYPKNPLRHARIHDVQDMLDVKNYGKYINVSWC